MDRDMHTGKGRRGKDNDCPSVDEYARMSEREKDVETLKAVIRLQTRIQKILFLMDMELKGTRIDTQRKEVREDAENAQGRVAGPRGPARHGKRGHGCGRESGE